MGRQPREPSPDEIAELRSAVLNDLQTANVLSTLDNRDLKKFKEDDAYTARFLMHNFNDEKKAQAMAVDTLKWRAEMKVNDLTVDSVKQELLNKGLLIVHNRDIDGCKMLIFSVQMHTRGSENVDDLRKLMIYWVERLEREEKGKWISVVFDMHNTGMKNMDMDMIQYVINLFKFYYPYILNYILVLDMPWILNAVWKIIKSWLPPEAIEKIKFLDKKTVLNYVPHDQCLTSWGGVDDYVYKFEPEKVDAPVETPTAENKKVTFAETGSTGDSSKTSETASLDKGSFDGTIMVHPPEELVFSSNRVGATAPFVLQNRGESPIAYKIKTTSPEKFRVKPSVGVLAGSEQKKIWVTLIDGVSPATLVRDKFLVVATPTMLPADAIPDNDIFKNPSAELSEVKLRVGLESSEIPQQADANANHIQMQPAAPPAIIDKLNQILSRQGDLEQQIVSARRIMFYTLLVMITLSILVIISNNGSEKILPSGSSSPSIRDPTDL